MAELLYLLPSARGLLSLAGPDARTFLQGLVSNDVTKVSAERAVHAALLTPQGKYLHDFFIVEIDGGLYLDCEAARREDLRQRLARYKLRSKVEIADATEGWAVALAFGAGALPALGLDAIAGQGKAFGGGVVFVDPRLTDLGARAILPRGTAESVLRDAGFVAGTPADYDRLRLSLGVADGSRDLVVEKSILLENGFDELHGVDWQKGCYVGQELTARTKYRALIRKRLLPVAIEGPAPVAGTPVMLGDKEVGEMRSATDGLGLALLRLDALEDPATVSTPLLAGESRVTPRRPHWLSSASAAGGVSGAT